MSSKPFFFRFSLVQSIIIGLTLGAIMGLLFPGARWLALFGRLFVDSLKAIAPLLVFIMVISSLARSSIGFDRRFGFVIFEYLLSTFLAALTAVALCFAYPVKIRLVPETVSQVVPGGVWEVLGHQVLSMVSNPFQAIAEANYISVLFWAIVMGGVSRKYASDYTKKVLADSSEIISKVVAFFIKLAPFGIFGLVFESVASGGLAIFADYGRLLVILVGSMLVTALILNPLVIFCVLHRNPYPLVLRCLRESGITAFFTRSSAANIPVNMRLCERLGLDKEFYSVSIPLGATINMDGAAVTITVMTLAAANTMNVNMTVGTSILLSILGTVAACGASGVAGGSLLLIPMACSLFGISQDVAMQVVGVGFIIGVIQDSVETALNSSGDAIFTATAEYAHWRKLGKSLPTFLGGTTKTDL